MTVDELTPWLFSRVTGGIRWGLERTEELLAGVGNPHRRFNSILIGGTNGKGSVAALCDAALRAEGKSRIGLYTSPHLVSMTERVRIDGRAVAAEDMAGAAGRLRAEIERTGATFFEATTAIAFLMFGDADVDLAVVEVGLGGRLDSTNVLRPLVTGVTNVALDHTEYLGTTISEIAAEKAGIFKAGVPAVTATKDREALEVLREKSDLAGAPFHLLDDICRLKSAVSGTTGTLVVVESDRWGEVELPVLLRGRHQVRNAMLALELLGFLPAELRPRTDSIVEGFAGVRWPGRLQVERIRGTTYLFDVAHNPAGARSLAESLPLLELPRPIVMVAGILSDKDWRSMLGELLPHVDATIATVADSAPAGRRWELDDVVSWQSQSGIATGAFRTIPDLSDALSRAGTLAPHGTVLVTGSVHTVGDALARLGIEI